jgi:hypothetical protein
MPCKFPRIANHEDIGLHDSVDRIVITGFNRIQKHIHGREQNAARFSFEGVPELPSDLEGKLIQCLPNAPSDTREIQQSSHGCPKADPGAAASEVQGRAGGWPSAAFRLQVPVNQRPRHCGTRFSANARSPSLQSSEAHISMRPG